jgi:hypothetical protein
MIGLVTSEGGDFRAGDAYAKYTYLEKLMSKPNKNFSDDMLHDVQALREAYYKFSCDIQEKDHSDNRFIKLLPDFKTNQFSIYKESALLYLEKLEKTKHIKTKEKTVNSMAIERAIHIIEQDDKLLVTNLIPSLIGDKVIMMNKYYAGLNEEFGLISYMMYESLFNFLGENYSFYHQILPRFANKSLNHISKSLKNRERETPVFMGEAEVPNLRLKCEYFLSSPFLIQDRERRFKIKTPQDYGLHIGYGVPKIGKDRFAAAIIANFLASNPGATYDDITIINYVERSPKIFYDLIKDTVDISNEEILYSYINTKLKGKKLVLINSITELADTSDVGDTVKLGIRSTAYQSLGTTLNKISENEKLITWALARCAPEQLDSFYSLFEGIAYTVAQLSKQSVKVTSRNAIANSEYDYWNMNDIINYLKGTEFYMHHDKDPELLEMLKVDDEKEGNESTFVRLG